MVRPIQRHSFQPCLGIALAAVFFGRPVFGQTAPPAAPVPTASAQQGSSQITTIRTFSNLVVIDVVVTDAQGNPVHGLKAEDFALTENNKPQALRHFEEHSALKGPETIAPAPKLPPGLFTNKSAAPANGPVNVLLLDYLNTPLSAQPNARKQLIDYLDHAAPGTRIAIFDLTTHLGMLQGFTSDMSVLKAALTMKKGAPQASNILSDSFNGGTQGDTTLSSALANDPTAVEGMVTQQMIDDVNRFEALNTSFEIDIRAKYTLGAFDTLARYLIGIPGRKNVIWFSAGFPLNVEPNVNEADPNDSVVRNDDEVRKTDNLLTRAQVAVYPVDARGLFTDPSQNFASESTTANDGSGADAAASTMAFMQQTAQEHETMEAMAEDTGGHAFYNNNNLTQAVKLAVENGSNYYTLTYSPSNMQWDARFRAIKVKLDQPGVKLEYRNGYYAVDPNDRNAVHAGMAATVTSGPTTMATAMIHGGPNPAEILFKVRIRPASETAVDTPLKTNQTNPDPKVKVQGPFKEYGVDVVPDPKAVNCRVDAKENYHCAIEVWTFVYNTDGEKLITQSNRLHTLMTPTDYRKMLTGGMAFHQEISVPVKGQYFLRTAIHDLVSDKVGAVEIPVASVAHLEPLAPIPAVDAPSVPLPASADAPTTTTDPVLNKRDAAAPATPTGAPATAPAEPAGTVIAPK